MKGKLTNYFAYGSNLSTKQIRRRLGDVLQGPVAHLRDHRLAFAGYAGTWGGAPATIRPEEGNSVPGVLYRLTPDQVKTLDRYEGANSGCYAQTAIIVHDDQGREHKAITYVRDDGETESPPSSSYVAIIKRGCRDHGIGVSALRDAVGRAFAPRVVFVYGSLLRGLHNHPLLAGPGAKFVGRARTRGGFALYDLGAYPGMVEREDLEDESVVGELYEVNAEVLQMLDRLEGHPAFYQRREIELEGGEVVETYTLHRDRVRGYSRVAEGDWKKYQGSMGSHLRVCGNGE